MSEPDKMGTALLAYLHALGTEMDVGFLRETLRTTLQLLMEMEVSAVIEASPYERNGRRRAYRNGYREHVWRSALGEIQLRIPKLRKGTYYPSFIDSLEEAEGALLALVQNAYLQGVSRRGVEETLHRLGIPASDPNQILRLTQQLDEMVYEFRERPLQNIYPSLWVDVLPLELPGRARRFDAVVAVGIQTNGEREILGFEVVPYAEGKAFWADFFNRLTERGLDDVEVLISDTYDGLKPALRETLPGTEWQARHEYTEILPQAFVSAVSPVLWVDTSLPDGRIVSSLSSVWDATIPVWGQVEAFDDPDGAFMIRLLGILLMGMQASWEMSREAIFIG
jgi:putative transposase